MSSVQTLDPPKGFFGAISYIGPGLILSAAIVGSGELIATTTLGAKAGFALLWVILFGCLAKTAVQIEYGRACILTGKTTLQFWNVSNRVHWTVIIAVLYLIATFAGQAGVLGGAAQVGEYLIPSITTSIWIFVLVIVLGLLASMGRYQFIEKISLIFNALFVSAILYCVFAIQGSEYAFTSGDLASGLQFQMPPDMLPLAVAAFGITGVAAGEISLYPYWCLEKGYAAWTGPDDGSPQWKARARGWIRVMMIDALISMIVFTIATASFYILGAAVLHTQNELADGNEFILQLSSIFTDVIGPNARTAFMVCSFTVLFSTIFANIAGFSRMWADFFSLCGWINGGDAKQVRVSVFYMAWVFPILSGLIYFVLQKPLLLVIFMGVVNSLFLIVVAYQTVSSRYWRTTLTMKPSPVYDIALWVSLASIAFMAGRSIYSLIAG
ncbi:MAG: Nramp family divalent metal transporter [Candidatus Hinthialibacter antarcticus]|nr:Nramp family divalent metal transporter [Candidatus Hinthialibacter antarcticus]